MSGGGGGAGRGGVHRKDERRWSRVRLHVSVRRPRRDAAHTAGSANRRFGGKSDPATGLPGMNVCGESVKVVAR